MGKFAKMKVNDILKQFDRGASFEFFPPKTEASKEALLMTVKALKEYNPLYVSMTCGAGGATQDRTQKAVNMLLAESDWVVMPHLTCIDAQGQAVKELLDRYKALGIQNIMVLRGDPPLDDDDFDFLKQEFSYGCDLVSFIKKRDDFCIGVAVYPEGHIETASLEKDIEYTKQKIDAGADFAITQMFFDNKYYYSLLERMRKKAIDIPVLPGILPLTNLAKVRQLASICKTTIPKEIEKKMERLLDQPLEMEKIGIEFTIKQCRELIRNGHKQLHFFTLNRPEVIQAILDSI